MAELKELPPHVGAWGRNECYDEVLKLRAQLAERDETIVRLREALEYIAESHDAGRHDGLPEQCPAYDAETMWAVANNALKENADDTNA